jgi:hypothetical protein
MSVTRFPQKREPVPFAEVKDWDAVASALHPCEDKDDLVCDEFFVCESHLAGQRAYARLRENRWRYAERRR